jgi:hypothetical protein
MTLSHPLAALHHARDVVAADLPGCRPSESAARAGNVIACVASGYGRGAGPGPSQKLAGMMSQKLAGMMSQKLAGMMG